MFRILHDGMSVSPQISIEDIAAAKEQGYSVIINNRPDGEDDSAPQSADIQAATEAAGMSYIAIPVTHAGFSLTTNQRDDKSIGASGKGRWQSFGLLPFGNALDIALGIIRSA